jgi:uncharacterized protein YjbJ (UPF0337 family)
MEIAMNWSEVEANWKEVKGKAKQAWGHLTDDDLDKIAGKRDELEGRIQKHYGLSKDVAKRNVDEWMQKIREPEAEVQHVGGMSMDMIVLGGIFALVVVALIGLSLMKAPQYPAGYPADRMTSSK